MNLLPCLLLLCSLPALCAAEFFVAPTGDDANPGTRSRPFATLERARDAVRAALPQATGDLVVSIRAGTYRLGRTLTLGPADGGRDGVTVVWRSADGIGEARVSGSAPIVGWQRHTERIWKVQLPVGTRFHTLYENGVRLRKARFPNYRHAPDLPSAAGDYHASDVGSPKLGRGERTSWIEYAPDAAPPGAASVAQMKIAIFPWGTCDWHRWTCDVTAIDRGTRRIEFDNLGDGTEILEGARYFLEDALAFLDARGEFSLDRESGTLYCIPNGEGHPDTLAITAPGVLTLLELRGTDREHPLRQLRLEGLTLEETDAIAPSLFWWKHDWGRDDHALVRLTNTEQVTVRNCHLRNSGRHGLLLVGHNVGDTIYGCRIERVGISGVTLSNRFNAPADERAPRDRLERNLLCNNRIHDVGQLGLYASCVELMNCSHNEVCHSELFHSPRYATTMRGNTGAQHGPPLTTRVPPARENRLHHLRIHHCGQDSGDMGALHAANLNNPGGDAINSYEQIVIADTRAIDGMFDIAPNGIFLDWPKMAMGQVFRHIHVIRSQGDPFRSNGPENAASAVMDNVSWNAGFHESRMDYASIGVKPDYPTEFGGCAPPPVLPAAPRDLALAALAHDEVNLRWIPPATPLAYGTRHVIYRDGAPIRSTSERHFTDPPGSGSVEFRTDHLLFHAPFDSPKPGIAPGQRFLGGATLADTRARPGRGLLLDGRGAWVEGPAELNLGAGDFTLAAWIRKDRSGSRVILSKGDDFGPSGQWTWGWEQPQDARNVAFRSKNLYFASLPGSVRPRRWVHIAFVRQENVAHCYIDGARSGEPRDMSAVGDLTSQVPLLIGRRPLQRSPAWFGGMIDDLRIYARALSADEVRDLATSGR